MPTITVTVVLQTDDELDDSMAMLERQVAESLGWLGEVETVDAVLEDEPGTSPDSTGYSRDLDEQLSAMFDNEDIEWDEE